MILFLVGKVEDAHMEIVGLYSSEDGAQDACLASNYLVWPLEVDKSVEEQPHLQKLIYYPRQARMQGTAT